MKKRIANLSHITGFNLNIDIDEFEKDIDDYLVDNEICDEYFFRAYNAYKEFDSKFDIEDESPEAEKIYEKAIENVDKEMKELVKKIIISFFEQFI